MTWVHYSQNKLELNLNNVMIVRLQQNFSPAAVRNVWFHRGLTACSLVELQPHSRVHAAARTRLPLKGSALDAAQKYETQNLSLCHQILESHLKEEIECR